MKNKNLILTLIGLIAGSVLIGCYNNQEKVDVAKENVKQANQDLKDAQAKFEKEWQQFKSDTESKISANEKSIDEFKAKLKTSSTKFKAKYEKEVAELEQKNIELKKKISEYKFEGKDKWEEFKQEVNKDIDIVGNAVKDIFSKKD